MAFGDSFGSGGILAALMKYQQQQPTGGLFGLGQPPQSVASVDASNYNAANSDLGMSPQEQFLYKMHLRNLYGSGGVDNPDGSRSTLFQVVMQGPDGRYYNIPTVWGGKIVPPAVAAQNASRIGINNFPSYASPDEADARYSKLHDYMEKDTANFFKRRGR